MPFQINANVIVMFLLYYGAAITPIFTKWGENFYQGVLSIFPKLSLITPLFLFVGYLLYVRQAGGIDWPVAVWVFFYFMAPALLLWPAKAARDKLTWWDGLAILAVWLPLVLHWWPIRHHAVDGSLDKTLLLVSQVIIGLVCWVCQRQLSDTKTRFSFRPVDLAVVFFTLLGLVPVLLLGGMELTHFLKPQPFWAKELANSNFPQVLFNHLASGKLALSVVLIFLGTALVEEFFFRGIVQNFLQKIFKNQSVALVVAAFVFACEHLSHGSKSFNPATWNLTYAGLAFFAGLGYGLVFRYTSSIVYAFLLHALVDALWITLFVVN